MRIVSAAEIDAILTFPSLIDGLEAAFAGNWTVPVRHHHAIESAGAESTLLLMPAWTDDAPAGGFVGTKIVSVVPGNAGRSMPTVIGAYLLLDGATGSPLAVMDGTRLTLWRTAAASALAAKFLARRHARRLVLLGAGSLAPFLARAHASVRPIDEVLVWNRGRASAAELARALSKEGFHSAATEDLASAIGQGDIVSCATLSSTPVVAGALLPAGVHLDLVGAFKPTTREADNEAVLRSRVFVDTRSGALQEAGDLVIPLSEGIITPADVLGDLAELCRGTVGGRSSETEITLFKSVGTALEDLAAAILVWKLLQH